MGNLKSAASADCNIEPWYILQSVAAGNQKYLLHTTQSKEEGKHWYWLMWGYKTWNDGVTNWQCKAHTANP
jgi:hypothetical protein